MKKTIAGIALLLGLILLGSGWLAWRRFAIVPLSNEAGEFTVDVAPGTSFFSIRKQLADQGVAIDPFALRMWIRLHRADKKLRVGEYRLQRSWSRLRILNEILAGTPIQHKLIVKEGNNIWDVRAEIARIWGQAGAKEFDALVQKQDWLARMGVPQLPAGVQRTLEGFLFPETYSYMKYDSPKQVVQAMLDQFDRRAKPMLESHPWGPTPEGRYRLLTLASIVEKESGNPQEQPLVASVFWNRLKKKMRLQSDPTTIYALFPNFDGNLRRIDLVTPSAYNTYMLPELPAGPISNPGETAIQAVLAPAQSEFLYFVGNGQGAHMFAADLKAHNANVRKYQLHR